MQAVNNVEQINKYIANLTDIINPSKGKFTPADIKKGMLKTNLNFDKAKVYVGNDKQKYDEMRKDIENKLKQMNDQFKALGVISIDKSTLFPYSVGKRPDYPYYKSSHKKHSGTDFPRSLGTKINATRSGKIIQVVNFYPDGFNIYQGKKPKLEDDPKKESRDNSTYGNRVVMEFTENGKTYHAIFAHLQQVDIEGIEVGQLINQGDVIGHVGNTGNSSGPHLHFEVRQYPFKYENNIDPAPFLR